MSSLLSEIGLEAGTHEGCPYGGQDGMALMCAPKPLPFVLLA
jgi:hypothetical protein